MLKIELEEKINQRSGKKQYRQNNSGEKKNFFHSSLGPISAA